jgi:1,4-dihydroxy-2-naphthoate octaprenyltransferase
MNKTLHLQWAEAIDAYRIIPRIFLAACFAWTIWVSYICLIWYIHLPHAERGLEATGFGSVVFLTVFGFLKLVYTQYATTGRDWNAQPPSVTTSSSTTTIATGATP